MSTLYLLLLFLFLHTSESLRIRGEDHSISDMQGNGGRKYKYLDKFGVFKDQSVFLYGDIKITTNDTGNLMALAFITNTVWNQFRPVSSCDAIHRNLQECTSCYNLSLSIDPSSSSSSSYSFHVNNTMVSSDKTQFWFTVLIYCNQSGGNGWVELQLNQGIDLSYELYIVNEDPNGERDLFYYQFPGNEKGFLITYLVFSILYVIVIPVHLILHIKSMIRCKTPLIINLFTLALVFEGVNIYCGLIHYGVYAHNGYGAPPLNFMKTFFNLVGDWFLIIILVLVAGGWMVTLKTIKWKVASFVFISLYIFFSIVYYIATVVYMNVEPWKIIHPLQDWSGAIYLTARSFLLFYVWYQIYQIHRQEETLQKLRLYRALFGIFTVWFWYLPLTVLIVTFINPVISWVVLINIMNAMNFLVNLFMISLFCPWWSTEYFQFQNMNDTTTTGVLMSSSGGLNKKYQLVSADSYEKSRIL